MMTSRSRSYTGYYRQSYTDYYSCWWSRCSRYKHDYHMMSSSNCNYEIIPSGQDTERELSLATVQSIILPLDAALGTSVLAIHSLVNVSYMQTCSDNLMHLIIDKNLPHITFHSYLQWLWCESYMHSTIHLCVSNWLDWTWLWYR